jgi:amino acid transporter
LSGTLGVGLYVQGGAILRLGGPCALIASFVIMAVLAWSVMQCIAEMICIWPISGALYEFVSVFVDNEVGIAVGVAYWYDPQSLASGFTKMEDADISRFTNAIGFAAIMNACAGELWYWTVAMSPVDNRILNGAVIFTIVPIALIWLNSLGVKVSDHVLFPTSLSQNLR